MSLKNLTLDSSLSLMAAEIKFHTTDPRQMKFDSWELKEWREKNEMTQETLAKLIGVDPTSICLWENGKAVPSVPACILLMSLMEM